MHFPESSIIITRDGLYCQVYGNHHPEGKILVKPKYIPTDKVFSDSLPYRFISGRKMNRLDLWTEKGKLKEYIDDFSRAYPEYMFESLAHDKSPILFAVPLHKIDRIYLPKEGLAELKSMPEEQLDEHLSDVVSFVNFLLKSGLSLNDMGITYSTLMGHYFPNKSDLNIVIYGKNNYWKLMNFLDQNNHEGLRWKTYEDWEKFYKKRNRGMIHEKEAYLKNMHRRKSEGFFNDNLFVIFCVENDNDVWTRWGEEKYRKIGRAKFAATVEDSRDSVVRPGRYKIAESKFIDGDESCRYVGLRDVVFYSRDYCMFAFPGEKIEVSGVIEEVTKNTGEVYHRLVIGYFDSYLNGERDQDYLKLSDGKIVEDVPESKCNLCLEADLPAGSKTGYGSIIVYKNGSKEDGWFATLSPKTNGDVTKDFTVQIMPRKHVKHMGEVGENSELAKNYGLIFSQVSKAITKLMKEENRHLENEESAVRVGTYGKSKHPEEHFHVKLFPWKHSYVVDSTYESMQVLVDGEGSEFVKMEPTKKKRIDETRLRQISEKLIRYSL